MEPEAPKPDTGYTVVARRYRPKTFDELIGQDHIAQALGKAISAGRVGHAYLFTGARGVGKTSTARIFAKVLNTSGSSTEEMAADISQAIDAGDDMDVIEIDGASNRGIEEIRQLRANVNVRPSRAKYKIYIIDEVHMLTNQAFNALLKTLEEPPAHVKFIFCTTDPDKIPITVLSRCQRFDFVPVKFEAIQQRLKEISKNEGFEADDEALGLLARRAAGSMRDSQSLLEQVMSFTADRITVEQVHALLGIADEGQLLELVLALADAEVLKAIGLVDQATRGGADAGQLAEQLLNFLRDVMAAGVGGGPDLLKFANPSRHSELQEIAKNWGVQTILSAIQIVDESLVRMRTSVSSVTLLEVAIVQICQLEQLESIPALLEAVMNGSAVGRSSTPNAAMPNAAIPSTEKKKVSLEHVPTQRNVTEADSVAGVVSTVASEASRNAPEPSGDGPLGSASATKAASPSQESEATAVVSQPTTNMQANSGETSPLTSSPASSSAPTPPNAQAAIQSAPANGTALASSDALESWRSAVAKIDGMLADFAGMAMSIEPQGSDHWRIVFPPGAQKPYEYCEQGERRSALQAAIRASLGREIRLEFAVKPGQAPPPTMAVPQSSLRAQKLREMSEHPYVKKLLEVIGGEIIRVDAPREPVPTKVAGGQANKV